MTGLVRRATLITAAGLLAATAAMAGVPSASTSIQPAGIALVGYANPADPTAFGAAVYTIKDANGNAVPGSTVIINFASCTDIKLCSNVTALGVTVNCSAKTASAVTNATGQVTLRVVGASNSPGGVLGARRDGPGQLDNACASVTADGVPMAPLIVSAFDLTGDTGIGAGDVFVWGKDFVDGDFGRSDYDANGDVGANDLFRLGQVFVAGASNQSCHDCTP